MQISKEKTQEYISFVNDLFKNNSVTNNDVNRINYDNSSGNNTFPEQYYWVNLLAKGFSKTYVEERFNNFYKVSTDKIAIGINPIAQSFYISPTEYPSGIFISSVELFFATKDEIVPVSIEIRPLINGYPSSSTIIPLTQVSVLASNVQTKETSLVSNGIGDATKFTFDAPVYLQSGEYALVIKSNSDKYTIYSAILGKVELGTSKTLVQNAYIGSLFKSQNATTWTAEQLEDICFKINRCEFNTGTLTFDAYSKKFDSEINYDLVQLMSQEISFGNLTDIKYSLISKDLSNTYTNSTNVLSGKNLELSNRMLANNYSDLIIRTTLTNTNSKISPIIDLERFGAILVKNKINSYSDSNSASELLSSGGENYSKYITKKVTLANNFDANGLTIYLNINRQPGTKIEIFAKILNKYDFNFGGFEAKEYIKIPFIGNNILNTNSTDYVEDKYQLTNMSYTDDSGNIFNTFNTFCIKIVMYSENPAIVPKIKNLRCIATYS